MERPCACLATGVDIALVLFHQNALSFDLLLETDAKLATHMQKMLGCQQCCGDDQMPHTVLRIIARLLDFDKAALSAYSVDGWGRTPLPRASAQGHSPPASSRVQAPPPAPHQATVETTAVLGSPQCVLSHVTLGELSLDPSESRMLVEQLLGDSLTRLNGILNELKAVSNERLLMCPDDGHVVERLIDQTMNGIAKLTGQLHSR